MENRLGHNSTIRSLVRPVSPLSRWAKLPIPINENDHRNIESDEEKDRENRNENEKKQYSTLYTNNTNRSRSPILPSTVHLPNHDQNFDQTDENKNSSGIILAKETRRIIVHDSLKSNTDVITDKQNRLKHKSSHHQRDHNYHKSSNFYKKSRLMNSHTFHSSLTLSSPINRDTTCPILLRMFYSVNARHYSLDNYTKGKLPENEIQMNTWIDVSLKELAEEIRHVCRLARRRGTRMHFAIVYPDSHGTYGRRQLGVVITGFGSQNSELLHNNNENNNNNNNVGLDANVETENKKQKPFNLMDDSSVTLLSKRYQIGDYIDCAIVEYIPGSLVGWSSGRRPLGPKPSSPNNSKREELPKI